MVWRFTKALFSRKRNLISLSCYSVCYHNENHFVLREWLTFHWYHDNLINKTNNVGCDAKICNVFSFWPSLSPWTVWFFLRWFSWCFLKWIFDSDFIQFFQQESDSGERSRRIFSLIYNYFHRFITFEIRLDVARCDTHRRKKSQLSLNKSTEIREALGRNGSTQALQASSSSNVADVLLMTSRENTRHVCLCNGVWIIVCWWVFLCLCVYPQIQYIFVCTWRSRERIIPHNPKWT